MVTQMSVSVGRNVFISTKYSRYSSRCVYEPKTFLIVSELTYLQFAEMISFSIATIVLARLR